MQKYIDSMSKMVLLTLRMDFVSTEIVNRIGLKWLEVVIQDVIEMIFNSQMVKYGHDAMCISDIPMDDLGIFNGER